IQNGRMKSWAEECPCAIAAFVTQHSCTPVIHLLSSFTYSFVGAQHAAPLYEITAAFINTDYISGQYFFCCLEVALKHESKVESEISEIARLRILAAWRLVCDDMHHATSM